jgi:hypothetical protein
MLSGWGFFFFFFSFLTYPDITWIGWSKNRNCLLIERDVSIKIKLAVAGCISIYSSCFFYACLLSFLFNNTTSRHEEEEKC